MRLLVGVRVTVTRRSGRGGRWVWSYLVVAIVCLGVGGLCVWVYPKSRRVRMNMTVHEIVDKTFHWTGHKRFRFTGWYDAKDEESGIIWAESEHAAKTVLLRTYFHVQVEQTERQPVSDSDNIVY